jgi:hypothetical protein
MKSKLLIFYHKYKTSSLVLVALFIFTSLVIPNDIKELNKKLKEKKYHATIKMTLFSDSKMADTVETQRISINVFNTNLHYKFSSFELYSNSDYSVVIDHNDKTILINKNVKIDTKKKELNFDPMDFDSLFYDDYNFATAKNSINTKTYVISSPSADNEISYINFTFNPKELIPQKIFIKYSKTLSELLSNIKTKKETASTNPVLMINYESFKYDLALNPIEFNFSHILTINHKKEVILKSKYSNYIVYNYLITNN